MPLILLLSLAWAQEASFASILDEARGALVAKDYSKARSLLDSADKAAGASTTPILGPDLGRLYFYRGLVEWRAGDKDKAALDAWRQLAVVTPEFEMDKELLPETDGQDVIYALAGEVKSYEQVLSGIPEDTAGALVFVDGRRPTAEDSFTVGRHLLQVRCPEQGLVSGWYRFGPAPDYLTVCNGGSWPVETPIAEGPAKKNDKKSKADAEKAAKEAAKLKAEAEKKAKAEAEAKAKADAKAQAEAEAKARSDAKSADSQAKADSEAKARAEAEAKAKAEAEAKAKADAEKTATTSRSGSSTTKVDRGGGSAAGIALMSGGGALVLAGVATNFLLVDPAYARIDDANANCCVTQDEADRLIQEWSTDRWITIGLLGAGIVAAGTGLTVQLLSVEVLPGPGGLWLNGHF